MGTGSAGIPWPSMPRIGPWRSWTCTHNVIEQFFGRAKQGPRRLLGRAHLGRELEDQPAYTALTGNLRHPDCVQILRGTLDQLPQTFAQLDRQTLSRPPRLQRKNRNEKLRPSEPGVGQGRSTPPAGEQSKNPSNLPRTTGR